MKVYLVISRHIDGTAVVQCRMKHRNCVVFCHIDLVQDTESAIFCTAVDTSLAKLHFVVLKSIRSDQITTVGIYVKRYIVRRTVKNICQVLGTDILAGRCRSGQEQVLTLEDGCDRHLQDLLSIERYGRFRDPSCCFFLYRISLSEFFDSFYQFWRNILFLQKS